MSLFHDIFNKNINTHQQSPLAHGEKFPIKINNSTQIKTYLIIALSLSCATCIDYIEDFDKLVNENDIKTIFIISGEDGDVQFLSMKYNDKYFIIPITNHEMVNKYKVYSNPFMYILDSELCVQFSKEVDNVDETNKYLKKFIGI